MWFRVLALAVAVGLAALLLRPRPSFVVIVQGGEATKLRGKVPRQFADDCASICSDLRLSKARIRGFATGQGTRLRFSREIPAAHHQRFRNAWHTSAR